MTKGQKEGKGCTLSSSPKGLIGNSPASFSREDGETEMRNRSNIGLENRGLGSVVGTLDHGQRRRGFDSKCTDGLNKYRRSLCVTHYTDRRVF